MKKLIAVTACLSLAFLMIFAGCKEAARNIENILSQIEKTEDDGELLSEIEQNENERTENRKSQSTVSENVKPKKPQTVPESEPTGEQSEYKSYCYSFLNHTQKGYYTQMLSIINDLKTEKVLISGEENENIGRDISIAFTSILADHPELFWLKGGFKTFMRSDTGDTYIQFSYLVKSAEQLQKMQSELDNTVNALLDATDNLTYFEKEVYFHDYLCENVDYEKNDGFCHTAYGALIEGKSVCEGYSKAMQLLLNLSDMNCVTVRGEDDEGYAHMWNKVELSGEWYALDVTWDDPVNAEKTSYNFFNLTDKEMGKTHTTDKTYTKTTLPEEFEDLEYNFCLPEANGKYYRADKIDW